MKRIRLTGWAVLVVAGGALAGCHKNQHQGPHYSGWGGCYSHVETDRATGRIDPSLTHGFPMVPPDEGGHPVWTQPSNGAGVR